MVYGLSNQCRKLKNLPAFIIIIIIIFFNYLNGVRRERRGVVVVVALTFGIKFLEKWRELFYGGKKKRRRTKRFNYKHVENLKANFKRAGKFFPSFFPFFVLIRISRHF